MIVINTIFAYDWQSIVLDDNQLQAVLSVSDAISLSRAQKRWFHMNIPDALSSSELQSFSFYRVSSSVVNVKLVSWPQYRTNDQFKKLLPFLGTRKGSHKQVRRVNQEAVGGRRNYGCLQSRQYCLMFIRDYRTFQQTTLSGAGTFALIFSFISDFWGK
jgi:hypothetical protein